MFKKAFTLAEVLITLGIIGVVAALTIPSIISHYNKVVMSARNKKFVSSINQAILRSTADNGLPHEWARYIKYHDPEALYDWFDEYIMQYMRVLKNCRENPVKCIADIHTVKLRIIAVLPAVLAMLMYYMYSMTGV